MLNVVSYFIRMSTLCHVTVSFLCLFLAVIWVSLQCVLQRILFIMHIHNATVFGS